MLDSSAIMRFGELTLGARARVVRLSSDSESVRRLQEMGLTVGTEIRVTKVAPFGDPIEVLFRRQRICVRRSESEGIDVELL